MHRLIYRSRCAVHMNWDLVRDLSNSSERNNLELGLTGILLASSSHFLQVIEGNFEDVNAVYRRICQDDRHDELTLIDFSVVDSRLFDGWGMKGIGVFDMNEQLEKQLIQKYGEENGVLLFPLEAWTALALIQDIRLLRDLPEWKH